MCQYARITQYIARHPVSKNHATLALHSALARARSTTHAHAAMGMTNSFMPEIQAISAANLAVGGSQSSSLQESLTMSDAELGAKRRAELMAGPQRTTKCNFWGWQNGALQCGKTMMTGYPCTFAQYHNLDHQGGPMQKYERSSSAPSAGPPVAGGQSL